MSDKARTRRSFLAGGAGAITVAGLACLARTTAALGSAGDSATTGTATESTKKYAVVTLELKWTKDKEFRELMTAVIPHLAKHGVTLVRCWISAIGQYRKVVSVWDAPSHSEFLSALSDPMLEKYRDPANALGSATVDFASLLVTGPRKISPDARRHGVIVTGTVTIQPGMVEQFSKILVDSFPTMGRHGVILEASFHTEVGNRNRVLDLWWAPDANSVYQALSDPVLDAPAVNLDYSSTMAGELVEISTELTFP
jgi:hypothetical protein